MNKKRPPLALIAGPTASGKSGLALELAKQAGGIIINADASQLYRGIETISAAPDEGERNQAPHRLYAFRDPAKPCSAADWAKLASAEIARAHEDDMLPILVGGTGMYIRTLLDGIAPIPPIDPEIRAEIRAREVADNRAELKELDPKSAGRLNAGDTARIARALEVIRSTGKPITYWHDQSEGGIGDDVELRPLVLLPPREWLYERCDRRFIKMIDEGAIEEVEALLEQDIDPDLPAMRAIGVPEIAAYLSGELDREAMIEAGQLATRRFAKRQYTWFRHQPPDQWPRFSEPLDQKTIDDALALIMAND